MIYPLAALMTPVAAVHQSGLEVLFVLMRWLFVAACFETRLDAMRTMYKKV